MLLWLSSPENVRVADVAYIAETSKYGPCFLLLNVFSGLEETFENFIFSSATRAAEDRTRRQMIVVNYQNNLARLCDTTS